jgi:DNA-binding NarL/FixJ family response regulator
VVDGALAGPVRGALDDLGFDVVLVTRFDRVVDELAGAPSVVVFDGAQPGWLGTVARLVERWPDVRSLLIDDLTGPDDFLSALAAGVSGFCGRDASQDAIARSVRSMLESGVAIPRSYMAPLVESVRSGRGRSVRTAAGSIEVTDREWQILQMLVQRRTTREMADVLFVSVGTVRSHVSALLKKLGAVDREDAVSLIERGRGRAG